MRNATDRITDTDNELIKLRARVAELEEALRQRKAGTADAQNKALRRQETSLAEAQRVAHMGNWDLDLQTGAMTWSAEIYRIFDVDPSTTNPSYLACLNTVHPDDREYINLAYVDSVVNYTPYNVEHRLLLRDGTLKFVHQRCGTIYDEKGEAVHSIGTVQDITERKLASQALSESERRFRAVFESTRDGILIMDCKGKRFLNGNQAASHMLGFSTDELCGMSVKDLLRAEDHPYVRQQYEEIRSGQANNTFELSLRRKDDSFFFVEATGFSIVIEENDCVGVIFRDITRRKDFEHTLYRSHDQLEQHVRARTAELRKEIAKGSRAEQALRHSVHQYRSLVSNIPGAIYRSWLDADWSTDFVSTAIKDLCGYPAVDFMEKKRSYISIIHPEDKPFMEQQVQDAMERRQPYILEYRIIHADGSIRWFHDNGRAAYDEDGEPQWLDGVIFDITERKATERRLRDSELRFRVLFEQAAVGVAQLDSETGRFIQVNRRYCEIVGYSETELSAKKFQELTYADDLREELDNMAKLLEGTICEYSMEKRYIRKDGLLVWVNLHVSPMWASGEEPNYYIAVVEDITDRKRAEADRLAFAHRQRDTLIREVHHRIKNNLQGVIGLLGQQARRHPEIAEHLNEALIQLESVALVFGLQSQEPDGVIILDAMVKAISNSINSYIQAPLALGVIPLTHPPARIATAEAVALALTINELLINAAKHQAAGSGQEGINVTQLYLADQVELNIINHGGLLPDFNFDRGRGLGTGLALVKSLLPRSGVRLRITGEGDLVRARLILRYPLVQNLDDEWMRRV